jgi:hypothetical protein
MRDADYFVERDGKTSTKFGGYRLPGGEDYRELLLTLPKPRYWLDGSPVTAEDLSTQHGRDNAEEPLRPGRHDARVG